LTEHQKPHKSESRGLAERERAATEYPRLVGSRRRRPIITGARGSLAADFYVVLLEAPWWEFLSGLAAFFLSINVIFAALYMLDPQGLTQRGVASFRLISNSKSGSATAGSAPCVELWTNCTSTTSYRSPRVVRH